MVEYQETFGSIIRRVCVRKKRQLKREGKHKQQYQYQQRSLMQITTTRVRTTKNSSRTSAEMAYTDGLNLAKYTLQTFFRKAGND